MGRVWDHILRPEFEKHARERAMRLLIKKQFRPALVWLEEVERSAIATKADAEAVHELFRIAKAESFEIDARRAWPSLVALQSRAPRVAESVWGTIANDIAFGSADFVEQLEPADLIHIYRWLSETFANRSRSGGEGGIVTTADMAGRLRERILSYLSSVGSAASLDALRRLQSEMKAEPWLHWYTKKAEDAYLKESWFWPTPREALQTILSSWRLPRIRSSHDRVVASITSLQTSGALSVPDIAADAPINKTIAASEPVQPPAFKRRSFLVVATEWLPRHGGLSNLNRGFCKAMASAGHEVICVVPEASTLEIELASKDNVQLIVVDERPGLIGSSLLLTFQTSKFPGLNPDFVVGHDHITGVAGKWIAEKYPVSKYLHFIHTIPREIEPYKLTLEGDPDFERGASKSSEQIRNCKQADLIIAMGPRIAAALQADLPDDGDKIFELSPGLEETLLGVKRKIPITGDRRVLFMGRLEDPQLKGIAVAAKALHFLTAESKFSGSKGVHLIIRGARKETLNSDISRICKEHDILPHLVLPSEYSADPTAIHDELRSCSLVVMPSRVEGFGLVALEAISAGVPVLIGQDSGIVQLLANLDAESANTLPGWKRRTVPVVTNDIENGQVWAEEIHKVMQDRDAAFREADEYRQKLSKVLTWDRASQLLTTRLDKL